MSDTAIGHHSPARPGAGSITWRIHGERVAVLGWGRAILLQLAHPLVAAGVGGHSSFRAGPLAQVTRLQATVRAMLALTFGSEDAARGAVARIRGIHDRVHGTMPDHAGAFEAGTPYSAHDPALLAWVHLTLLESVPLAYGHFVEPLDEDEVGRYCRESAWGAQALGVKAEDVPRSRAELHLRMEQELASGRVTVTAAARDLAHAVVAPPFGRVAGPMGRLHYLASVGWLPPPVRAAYGFAWTTRDDDALAAWCRRLRTWSRHAPAAARRWRAARRTEARRGDDAGRVTAGPMP